MTRRNSQELAAAGMNRTQLAIALYEQGYSARDVAELLDIPRPTVSGLVARVGISRERGDAVRLALQNRRFRTHVQHVTLLGDVVADVAAKLGITADLLLAVLADRLHTTDHAGNHTADDAADHADDHTTGHTNSRVADRGDDAAAPVAEWPLCVGVCSFGCTHRCARITTQVETAG